MGIHYVSNFVPEEDHSKYPKAPLVLVYCPKCTLVQLEHTAPQELLYRRFYWYRSGVTETMRNALKDITTEIESLINLKEGDVVLDIGSNDGTLLRQYSNPKIHKVGVEPAENLMAEGRKGVDTFISDFWSSDIYFKNIEKKAKAITAIGMFYDLEDPNQFIADIKNVLTDDGVFISQLMCLHNMIETNDVGNINHEHLEYYTFKSLEILFGNHDLEIVDVEVNDVNSQSYRVYARKVGGSFSPKEGASTRIAKVVETEKKYNSLSGVMDFFDKIEEEKNKCVEFIKSEHEKGKSIWIYGASTKGNTILQYYGLDNTYLAGAAERSPEKWGTYTIGTKVKCYSEEHARNEQPDYFLVLPYTFINEMYKREESWRDRGGKFIVPLPQFEVLE
jgi:SAM-dependent methyltransferase